ncbi:MAG: hypothetical protein QOG03_1744, partial [Actinomycetota bacterium]|nr:hypothetical protein [Actinomycetota bacterium]
MSKRIGVVAALCVLMGGLVSTGAMATPPKPLQMGSLTGVYESSRGGAGYGTYDIDLATIPTDGSAPSTTQWYCWHDYAGRGEVACGVSQSTEQLHGYASTPRFLDLGPPDFCLLGPLCVGPQTTAGTFSLSVALD